MPVLVFYFLMVMSATTSPQWRFSQLFGEKDSTDEVSDGTI